MSVLPSGCSRFCTLQCSRRPDVACYEPRQSDRDPREARVERGRAVAAQSQAGTAAFLSRAEWHVRIAPGSYIAVDVLAVILTLSKTDVACTDFLRVLGFAPWFIFDGAIDGASLALKLESYASQPLRRHWRRLPSYSPHAQLDSTRARRRSRPTWASSTKGCA